MERLKCLVLIFCCPGFVFAGTASKIISDEIEIQDFIKNPNTKIYDLTVPPHWSSVRKYIEVGQKISGGGCTFSNNGVLDKGNYQVIVEIAGDKSSCKSLMLEGYTDKITWNRIRESLLGPKRSPDYLADKGSAFKNQRASGAQSNTSAAAIPFNSGGKSYKSINSEIYTDGNNKYIQSINYYDTYDFLGKDFSFTAAGAEVLKDFSEPANGLIFGNCYDNQGNNASYNYNGQANYYTGQIGWKHESVYTCDAQTMAYGTYSGIFLTGLYYEQHTPGAGLTSAKNGSLCGEKSRSMHKSSCDISPYKYRETSVSYNYYISTNDVFYNNSSNFAFDCSAGLTIYLENIGIYYSGSAPVQFFGDSHWSGPKTNCGENLKLVRLRKDQRD